MTQLEATSTTHRLHEYSSTQGKHIANAVLHALRRPPTRVTQGLTLRFEVFGGSGIPNGPPPIEHARWWLGSVEPHSGLRLPRIGILISDTTMQDARPECTVRAWNDLYRIVNQSTAKSLYLTTQHGDGSWTAYATPRTGHAGDAARTILRHALTAGHATTHPLDKQSGV